MEPLQNQRNLWVTREELRICHDMFCDLVEAYQDTGLHNAHIIPMLFLFSSKFAFDNATSHRKMSELIIASIQDGREWSMDAFQKSED